MIFLLDFEKSGGSEKVAHTILAAASIPLVPIIGKEYQLINPLPQIKAMIEKNIPKFRFRNEIEVEGGGDQSSDTSLDIPNTPPASENRPDSCLETRASFNETNRDHLPFRPHNP